MAGIDQERLQGILKNPNNDALKLEETFAMVRDAGEGNNLDLTMGVPPIGFAEGHSEIRQEAGDAGFEEALREGQPGVGVD